MPLKLKQILLEHNLLQADWCRTVRQFSGRPLSRTAGGLLANWGNWPASTPRHSIEAQTRDWLTARGVPAEQVAVAFELDEGAAPTRPRHASPMAEHLFDDDLLEPEMLSPKARKYFRLFRDPFSADPECTEDVFRGPDQDYASEALWEAVRNHRLFALVGESGSGKTTLLDDFKDRVRRDDLPVRLIQPQLPDKQRLTSTGILEAIVRDLDSHAPLRRTNEGLTRQAHQLLAESSEAGSHAVLLFEEAHDLTIHALKQLKRFHEFKSGWKRLLSIVLVGQPELMVKLGEHAAGEAREVARRLESVTLLPLDEALPAYVTHKLARANARMADVFADDTWDALRTSMVGTSPRGEKVSMTYPLMVNLLLVKALNAAAELGAPRVDGAIVKDVFKRSRGV